MKTIFIGGCDRSGTTLLGSMLGSHSHSICTPESQFLVDTLQRFPASIDTHSLESIFGYIVTHPRFRVWKTEINLEQFQCDNSRLDYLALFEWIVAQYSIKVGREKTTLWIDHTPSNIKYARTLHSIFPDSKFVHIVRDGRAVAASIMPLQWGPRTIDSAAYFWLRNLAFGLAAEAYFGSESMIRIRYEDLVIQPQVSLQRLCKFLSIEYQPEMLEGKGYTVPKFSRIQHALVGQKPDNSRVDLWGTKLTARQIEIFENITADMLTYLGYDLKFAGQTRGINFAERVSLSAKELQTYLGNTLHQASINNSTSAVSSDDKK